MRNRRTGIALLTLSLGLMVSLVFNWHQFTQAQIMDNAAYNRGFESAFTGIAKADEILRKTDTKEDLSDAARYISESAGAFMAAAPTMHELGIDHIYGIGMRLDKAAQVISHPNHYSQSQVKQNEEFVHTVVTSFRACWNAQYLVKNRLPSAIDKIYNAMSPQERSQLYPLY